MGIVGDGLERAVQQAYTRPIPKSAGAQMHYLVKQLKGPRTVVGALGVSQRTVERYVKDQIRQPRAAYGPKRQRRDCLLTRRPGMDSHASGTGRFPIQAT